MSTIKIKPRVSTQQAKKILSLNQRIEKKYDEIKELRLQRRALRDHIMETEGVKPSMITTTVEELGGKKCDARQF